MQTTTKISENFDIKYLRRSKTDLSKETKKRFSEKTLYNLSKSIKSWCQKKLPLLQYFALGQFLSSVDQSTKTC